MKMPGLYAAALAAVVAIATVSARAQQAAEEPDAKPPAAQPDGAKPASVATMRKTPDGVEFGLFGKPPSAPAPLLIILSGNIEDSFAKANFLKAGKQLVPKGYLGVSIDLPCHGTLAQKGLSGLVGWGKRAAAGDDVAVEFNARMSKVVDYLVAEKLADPKRIVATGTSRGGYLAIRYAAHDPRVRCAVAYAPVADLRKLTEYAVAAGTPAVDKMSLPAFVPQLVGRPIWIAIGDRDDRVGTDSVIAFARQLSAAALEKKVPSEVSLHVLSEPRGHSLPAGMDVMSAEWIDKVIAATAPATP